MADFLTWCVDLWSKFLGLLGGWSVWGSVTVLGLCLAFIVIGALVRSLVVKSG